MEIIIESKEIIIAVNFLVYQVARIDRLLIENPSLDSDTINQYLLPCDEIENYLLSLFNVSIDTKPNMDGIWDILTSDMDSPTQVNEIMKYMRGYKTVVQRLGE